MFSRIVVGIDGKQGGTDALALGRRLASDTTELIAVSVALIDAIASRGTSLEYDHDMRGDAAQRLADVRVEEPGMRGEVVTSPSVGAGLHAAVELFDADLLVVGSCRRGVFGRIFAGDDVRATLRGAPCPVAIAPREYAVRNTPIETIGLGWNGGPSTDRALEVARTIGEDIGARVHALAVVDPLDWPALDDEAQGAANATGVELAAARLAEFEDVDAVIITGAAVEELAKLSAEVDLLVVGSHQSGPLGRVLFGTTSEHLSNRAVHPLLVVPQAAHPAPSPA